MPRATFYFLRVAFQTHSHKVHLVHSGLTHLSQHSALPMILGHGGLELRGRTNITLAKCYLSDPSFSISGDPYLVLDPRIQADEKLQIFEYHEMASEAFYLMAMVYNSLGQLQEREEAVLSFKKHLTALENLQDVEDTLFSLL